MEAERGLQGFQEPQLRLAAKIFTCDYTYGRAVGRMPLEERLVQPIWAGFARSGGFLCTSTGQGGCIMRNAKHKAWVAACMFLEWRIGSSTNRHTIDDVHIAVDNYVLPVPFFRLPFVENDIWHKTRSTAV